jgi:hypothetical protein
MTQRTVFAAVAQLVELGLIGRQKDAPTAVNRYRVIVSGDRIVSTVPPDVEVNSMPKAAAGPDETPPPEAISAGLVGPSATVSECGGVSTSTNHVVPLDDLIAAVYSPKCRARDVRPWLDVDEAELRICLEWLLAEGGVSPDMPAGFFAGCIRMAQEKLTGRKPP